MMMVLVSLLEITMIKKILLPTYHFTPLHRAPLRELEGREHFNNVRVFFVFCLLINNLNKVQVSFTLIHPTSPTKSDRTHQIPPTDPNDIHHHPPISSIRTKGHPNIHKYQEKIQTRASGLINLKAHQSTAKPACL